MAHMGQSFRGFSDGSVVKNPPANAGDTGDTGSIPGWKDPLEEETATHSSILVWKIPWAEEPGGLQTMGLQRVGHDTAMNTWTCSLSVRTGQELAPSFCKTLW